MRHSAALSNSVNGARETELRPLYSQVRDAMVRKIGTGVWRPGQMIPTEPELAAEFSVSPGTIRKALAQMEADNLVVRRQGRGTYVAQHSRQRALFHFFHITDESGRKELPTSVITDLGVRRASRDEALALALRPRSNVIDIKRVRYLKGRPILLEKITLPGQMFSGFSLPVNQTLQDELYILYERDFGVSILSARETIKAVAADDEAAALLEVAAGTPLLSVRRVALDVNGAPVELRVGQVNTADFAYYNDLQ